MKTRAQQLADAYEYIAKVNHYMIGIVETVTDDERGEAEQILITIQNEIEDVSNARYQTLNFALDLLEHDKRG